jgi:hypothetical protein
MDRILKKFDFNFLEAEKKVSPRQGSYHQLDQEALLTKVEDLFRILQSFPESRDFVDLGSGHGIGPLVFSHLYPHKKSIGIEFDRARFEQSVLMKSLHQAFNTHFFCEDLLSCNIPISDLYFLYFPTGLVLDRLLKVLGDRDNFFQLIVIESHGDLIPRILREKWLQKSREIPLISSRHYPRAVVFNKIGFKEPSFHDVSFLQLFLFIQDDENSVWVGDSFGMEWLQGDFFNLIFPPRTIHSSRVLKKLCWDELDDPLKLMISLRQKGDCQFYTKSGHVVEGKIRKIFVSPELKIEMCSGKTFGFQDLDLSLF